jgi:hypothetical protein
LHRYRRLGTAILILTTALPLSAQLAPVGAPKGSLRFDIQGAFQSADRRLFDGHTEDYLADFGSPAFGSNRMPLLKSADTLIGAILAKPSYRLNLGNQQAHGQLTIGTGTIGAALGVTSHLTLFADIPFVTTRVQARIRLDSTSGDAGLNPAHPQLGDPQAQTQADAFFSTFDNALATLNTQINNGTYSGNPALDSLAGRVFAQATALRAQLYSLTRDPVLASPFVPAAASTTGQQILDRIHHLQDTLTNTLSVSGTGFTGDPVLAASRVTDDQFREVISGPQGPILVFPLGEAKLSRMGDMDVGAVYTLVDRFDRPGKTGGVRLAVTGLLRLPTGLRDSPANLLDVGTGNGRYEVGVSGTADMGAGAIGARLTGGYLVRLSTLRVRRASDLGAPYATSTTVTNVRQDAGDILNLGAQPFLRLARNIALHGLIGYSRVGADAVRYDSPAVAIPGVPASVLAEGRRTSLAVGGGISYVGRSAHECETGHRCGWPVDASWNYSTIVSGSGGRVTKFRTTQLEIRWYQRLWH